MLNVEQLGEAYSKPIVTADDYFVSPRVRGLPVFYLGEHIDKPVDNPVIRPSINALVETCRHAAERPELGSARTTDGRTVNRFLDIADKPEDLLAKHDMQRELGRRAGTFERCVGVDAIGACHIVTFDIDARAGASRHPPAVAREGRVGGRKR